MRCNSSVFCNFANRFCKTTASKLYNMIDLLDNIDAEMNDNGARVVPIITEIHEVG